MSKNLLLNRYLIHTTRSPTTSILMIAKVMPNKLHGWPGEACKACRASQVFYSLKKFQFIFFAHCVEKRLERGEKSFSNMFFFFVYISDTHDNMRIKSRRKFVVVLKCFYFNSGEVI